MMSDQKIDHSDLINHTVDIVGAYLSRNHVQVADLPKLINDVHAALAGLGSAAGDVEQAQAKATPAQIRRSVNNDHLVSFEDGKNYKTLRRHLTMRGLTPEEYRVKWGLPHDYPMTSKSYSEQRSELARSLGLGQQRRKGIAPAPAATPPVEAPAAEAEAAPKAGRGRARKSA